jgi:mRNA-degrading endonuclease toxin of MazEF toxin-antitoxin module
MADLKRGRIVWVELRDPQGRNPKVRPAVVLTPTTEIRDDGHVQVAAITGETATAPENESVPLPWLGTGHPKTGLSKPSVAVASWVLSVPVTSITSVKGMVPHREMLELLGKVAELLARNTPSSPPPSVPPPSSGHPENS